MGLITLPIGLGIAAIVLGAVWTVANKGNIGEKLGLGKAGAASALSKLIDDVSGLGPVVKVTQDIDDLRRTLDSAMINKLRHRVEVLTDAAEKTKGYDALDALALIVLVPRTGKPIEPTA